MKISIELTREEIEDDLFILTRQRPSKRPRSCAKQHDVSIIQIFGYFRKFSVSM